MENPSCTLTTSIRHDTNDVYEDLLQVYVGAKRIDCKNKPKTTPLIHETNCDPPIEELVRHGVVCSFFDSLDREDLLLEFNAAWAPTNSASGNSELPNYGIGHGAMQKLIKLYKSSRDQIQRLHSTSASVECCDLVLDEFFLALDKLIDGTDVLVLRTVSKTLYKFCVFLVSDFSKKDRVYSFLKKLIAVEDLVVLTYGCWAIASIPCITLDDLQLLVHSDVCPGLVSLLISHFYSSLTPVLLILGKLVSGTREDAKYLIDLGVLPYLKGLLWIEEYNGRITKLACFFISKMTSYGSEHVQAVIEAGLVVPLIRLLKGHMDCKKDALLAIKRCASEAPPGVFWSVFDESCIPILCDLLASENGSVVQCCLEVISKIFSEADESRLVRLKDAIISSGGFEKIWRMKCYINGSICELAISFLRNYWEEEEYLCRGMTVLNS